MDSPPLPLDPRKRRLFRFVTVALVVGFGVAAAEIGLRWQQARIASSDALAPGLIRPDPDLGWSLTPYWKGRHQHHDFTANYRTTALGFRADTAWPDQNDRRPTTVVVGDSFTFGFGVDDTSTFVHRLDRAAPGGHAYGNAAIPGYSTDQQALLIARQVLPLRPHRILLVVYLGNDLFDNLRPVPLQVRLPKPYFEVEALPTQLKAGTTVVAALGRSESVAGLEATLSLRSNAATGSENSSRRDEKRIDTRTLVLRNVPVPARASPVAGAEGLTEAVLGPDPSRWPWQIRFEQQLELFRLCSQSLWPAMAPIPGLEQRLEPAIRLFGLIAERIRHECAQAGAGLEIALLAGRSHAVQPGSLSAQYQEVLRLGARREAQARSIPVIDVAAELRAAAGTATAPWFYPHDGHLTAAGHQAVADILIRHLSRPGRQ